MIVSKLEIHRFRNISSASLSLKDTNLLIGPNGSGKTSVLESLHMLSTGKSFRSHQIETIIQRESNDLLLRADVSEHSVGIQRFKNGKVNMRLDGENLTRVSDLARIIPTHCIDPNSISLIEGGPSERRKFLDFAMFHVEHCYLDAHKQYSAVLKQRNALLKRTSVNKDELRYWDTVFIDTAWTLNQLRKSLFNDVVQRGIAICVGDMLSDDLEIASEYKDGCREPNSKEHFEQTISENRENDIRMGTSLIGPHRADIILKTKGKLAKDYLSRGQKKLLTYGVRLAPAAMLSKRESDPGLVLIDDMPSELDEDSVAKVCRLLNRLNPQTVITAVDGTNIQTEIIIESLKPKMFHVEHGEIR